MDALSQLAQEASFIGRRAKKLLSGNNLLYIFNQLGLPLGNTTYGPLTQALPAVVTQLEQLIQAGETLENELTSSQPDAVVIAELALDVYDAVQTLYTKFSTIQNALTSATALPPGVTQQQLQAFATQFVELFSQYLLFRAYASNYS